MKKFFVSAICLILLASCSTVTRFNQTCITCVSSQRLACNKGECPTSFMVGNDCFVTIIETGENIYLNDILKLENIQPRSGIDFTIAKFNGRYFLHSDLFSKMWLLVPHKKNTAKIKAVELPEKNLGIVVFEINNNQLKMFAKNRSLEFIFDDENDKWINAKSVKAGE